MQYHIQTAPIWDAYKSDGCPLCALFSAREDRLVKQYLSDNVMDPDFRTASNSVGFCPEHIRMMCNGQNKLGLALQLETRAGYLGGLIKVPPADKKSARKTAECLKNHIGCVICSTLDEVMPRYYMTVAQMFDNESEFPELFSSAKHCVKHVSELYAAAEYAGKSTASYLAALTESFKRDMNSIEKRLRAFADCFDHNSTARPDPSALTDAVHMLITDKLN